MSPEHTDVVLELAIRVQAPEAEPLRVEAKGYDTTREQSPVYLNTMRSLGLLGIKPGEITSVEE